LSALALPALTALLSALSGLLLLLAWFLLSAAALLLARLVLAALLPKNSPRGLFSDSGLPGDSRANHRFRNDFPHASIVSVRWGGDEPSVPFQGFGCVDRTLSISDGAGSVVGDISSADGVFGPALHQPIEE